MTSKISTKAEALLKRTSRFLGTGTILFIDVCIAVLSSLIVILVSHFAVPSFFTSRFALQWLFMTAAASSLAFVILKTHRIIIRHTTFKDLIKLFVAVIAKELIFLLVFAFSNRFVPYIGVLLFIDLVITVISLISVRVVMITCYDILKRFIKGNSNLNNILVCGTSPESVSALMTIVDSPVYSPVGFLSPYSFTRSFSLSDYPVLQYKDVSDLDNIMDKKSIGAILFPDECSVRENDGLIQYASSHNIKALIVPSVEEIQKNGKPRLGVREIKIEDLLGRPEIKISMDKIREFFSGKIVMVTGAAGSIGSELVRQISKMNVEKIILFDNSETPMHYLRLELDDRFPDLKYIPVIGDVRHNERLDFAFRKYRPQIVFHAAAYKHVPLMEENPCEAVLVNLNGTRNVATKCLEYNVEKMVMISTDKAVNPTNVMGCSKRLAEIYVQSLGLAIAEGRHHGTTKFVTTRFGNVLGSNGSVIPRFREQIANGGPVTVTHPDINRFFMTIPEACRLVMEAASMPEENKIFVFDMGDPVKIDTLARRMIELAGLVPDEDIKIEYTGLRPGEKLYEEVLSDKENTYPTTHDRIRIAKVRPYVFEDVDKISDKLVELSQAVDIKDTLKLMMETVPEFVCTNKFLK